MSKPEADIASLPRYDALMQPTLRALAKLGRSGTVEEIDNAVVADLKLSQAQLDLVYPTSGAAIIADRLSWARSYLKIAGLIASERRGVWILTSAGREALGSEDRNLRNIVASASRNRAGRITPAEQEDAIDLAVEGHATWQTRLLSAIMAMKPDGFERLCQRLLRENGFTRVEVTGRSGDGGIDGIGVLRVNLLSFHVMFQCKKWKASVGAAEVRDFRGAMMGRAEKGLIFTTSTFTAAAQAEAARAGALPVDLVDGEALCGLLKELKLGVIVRQVEEVEIEADFFEGV